MNMHPSARARLTLLYTALVAASGGVLVTVTYFLVAHNLNSTNAATADQRAYFAASLLFMLSVKQNFRRLYRSGNAGPLNSRTRTRCSDDQSTL